ncbi:hypothetical protein GR7B_00169 [Vibrio phage vB_VcorM_GR7B]|nr:hypothetical protein GR7B_00169 [Vibrio phage vB_VcorM_GR7B]
MNSDLLIGWKENGEVTIGLLNPQEDLLTIDIYNPKGKSVTEVAQVITGWLLESTDLLSHYGLDQHLQASVPNTVEYDKLVPPTVTGFYTNLPQASQIAQSEEELQRMAIIVMRMFFKRSEFVWEGRCTKFAEAVFNAVCSEVNFTYIPRALQMIEGTDNGEDKEQKQSEDKS